MRELKFRAWDKIHDKYREPMVYDILNEKIVVRFPIETLKKGEFLLEQYTGLKDKNGKEIYEGDILGGIWESGFISWCERCKQFQYHSAGIGCMACSGDVHWYEIVEDNGKLEVIGNIHENQDLLGDTIVTNKEEE